MTKVLTKFDGGGTLEVELGAVWMRGYGAMPGPHTLMPATIKIEGEALRWMLQACLEALGETGVVLNKKAKP